MVELIRRVMCVSCFFASYLHANTYAIFSPADIVGGDVLKLRRMDATVVCLVLVISNMIFNVFAAYFLRNYWNSWSVCFFLGYQSFWK
jgi:hypothetical protein